MKKTTALILAISITVFALKPAQALEKGVLSFVGPIIGMPLGAVSGTIRGAMVQGSKHADDMSEAMGDGFWAKAVGLPIGLVGGIISGSSTGLLKGLYDGFVIGIEDPLSAESASLGGKMLEYKPYEIFEGSSTEQAQ